MNFDKQLLVVLGLAMALPSAILAVSAVVYHLIEAKLISNTVGLVIILAVIFNIFFLMFKRLRKQNHSGGEKDDQ
ncbi:MAG: hypothetical protein WD025_02795 [Bacteriovoracaceae bacterium]